MGEPPVEGLSVEGPPDGDADTGTTWDRPPEFPVALRGEPPQCTTCGQSVTRKSDRLTQLNAHHFAPKTHPRIVLRGKVDSLHALVLMAQARAGAEQQAEADDALGSIAAYCRELISAEYNERAVADLVLAGADGEAIHRVTHDPDGTLGIGHLTLSGGHPQLQHWLNLARTCCREVEIAGQLAFPNPHDPAGESICHALNRLSSAIYYVQLLVEQRTGRRGPGPRQSGAQPANRGPARSEVESAQGHDDR